MTPNREVELKLELAAASIPALKKSKLIREGAAPPRHTSEVSVYFDTEKHTLRRKGLTLRVRRIGKRYIQTIKASDLGLFDREEWEAEIAGETPDLDLLSGTALERLFNDKLRRKLKPLFETRVRRTVYPLANGDHAIALTVDRGKIDTGARSAPLCEVELELERGDVPALFETARELARVVPARLAVKSKSERGYELVDGEPGAPLKAALVDLKSGMTRREAFKAIGHACLKQIVGNEPALLRGDPEGVHQMRVGLRRLRAAMSLFGDILDDAQSAAMKAEMKWLAGALGPARELEVLVARVVTPVKKRHPGWGGVPSLARELAEKREAAVARAQDAVRSARFRALTLDIAAWLETGEWSAPKDDLVRDRGDIPIERFAADELARRRRKIRKRGKGLARLDPSRRHKLRIQAKKLRYGVEFFAGLFAGKAATKRRRELSAALGRLQDGLGDLHDIAVHEERMMAIGARRRPSSRKRAFAAGVLTGREDARLDETMAQATRAYEDFAEVRPFWR